MSQRRAEAVVQYLIHGGIEQSRLKAIGYGENAPLTSNDSAEGRKKIGALNLK